MYSFDQYKDGILSFKLFQKEDKKDKPKVIEVI
jgi:hypothetical protein